MVMENTFPPFLWTSIIRLFLRLESRDQISTINYKTLLLHLSTGSPFLSQTLTLLLSFPDSDIMMDYHHSSHHAMFARRPAIKDRVPAVRWLKEWVPQEITSAGKKCYLLKWVREDTLNVLKEKLKEPEPEEPKPEPTTEILYLCSYEGCNKSFPNEAAYRKHSHIHGERQYACSYPGCQKKFLDSSKLKRHQVVHTGLKEHKCPIEGCGKNNSVGMTKRTPPAEKIHSAVKAPATIPGSGSSSRPYVCNYPGCWKDYIHEYKLKLHFKSAHPGYNPEDNSRRASAVEHDVDEASDRDAYIAKSGITKRNKPSLMHEMPPAKIAHQRGSPSMSLNNNSIKKPWPIQMYDDDDDDDSEETEEEQENVGEGRWRYHDVNGDDDDDDETDDDDDD